MSSYYEDITTLAYQAANSFTGFNELQTAEITPIISLKSNYGISDLRDKVEVTGTGAVTNSSGRYVLSTGATASSTATLDSVERGRYISGELGLPGIGVRVPTLPTGDEEARWGYFNDDDGFGVGVDATGYFTFIREGGVERTHRREDWYDPIDGSREARARLVPSNVTVFRFPFRWYGSGPVLFEVTDLDSVVYPSLARFDIFSALPGNPIVSDPNLPIRAEVSNGSSASDFTLEVYGRQFAVLGRYAPARRITSDYRLSQSVGTSFTPLVTFRQKTTFDSVSVKMSGVSVATSSASVLWQVRINPNLTGASYGAPADIPASETALEFDKAATAMSGGQKIYEGIAVAGQGSSAGASVADVPALDLPVNQPITLCARSISGTATVTSVLKAREEW